MKNMIYFIPAMIIGVFIGIICSKKTDEKLFKKITLILLIVSGAWTILNTVKNMIG